MWPNSVTVLILCTSICVVVVESANSTTLQCNLIRKEAVILKQQCINDYVQLITHNVSIIRTGKECQTPQMVEDTFSAAFKLVTVCLKDNPLYKDLIKNSSLARSYLINYTFKDNKVQNFFSNGGLQCIRMTGQQIFDTCIHTLGRFDKPVTRLKNSITHILSPLYFYKASCSRRNVIMNCTHQILSRSCNKSSVDFVLSLHESLNIYCNNTEESIIVVNHGKSATGIILGVLLAIIILAVIAFIVIKKIRKSRGPETQTYNAEFHDSKK